MARIKKKGQAGAAKNYITRTQAIRKLQISLPDFRKLCIWKGIFPREPNNRKKVNRASTASTTFYYAKDIQYLLHEPLLAKFRDQKALEKKISRALGRGDVSDAARLEKNATRPEKTGRPPYTLDHLVRERYPTFVDALRDLDDALSMLFLFANLPSTSSVPAKMIARCERLCLEFQHYLIKSHSVRKSFLSIKGIYYQATIQGQDILWLVPYKFNQRVVGDVDFRIMASFVQFYMTLLKFVNFRLYKDIGVIYPPKFDQGKDDSAAELAAFAFEGAAAVTMGVGVEDAGKQLQIANGEEGNKNKPVEEMAQQALGKLIKEMKVTGDYGSGSERENKEPQDKSLTENEEAIATTIDKFDPVLPGSDLLPQPDTSHDATATLFANCTFFLSRETPRQPLEFLLRAFGSKRVGWDAVLGGGAFTTDEKDPRITHQVVDRPPVIATVEQHQDVEDNQNAQKLSTNQRIPGRIYVQPQWVWDSANDGELKRPDVYAPGASLPPHLSPFVKNTHKGYDPTVPLEEQEPEEEALMDSELDEDEDDDVDEDEDEEEDAKDVEGGEGMDVDLGDDDDDEEEGEDEFGGFSDEEPVPERKTKTKVKKGGPEKPAPVKEEAAEQEPEPQEEENEDDAELRHHQDLIAEITGQTVTRSQNGNSRKENDNNNNNNNNNSNNNSKSKARRQLAAQTKAEAEETERARGMLSKKKRKLYDQMIYSNGKRSEEDKKLRVKRRKLERAAGK